MGNPNSRRARRRARGRRLPWRLYPQTRELLRQLGPGFFSLDLDENGNWTVPAGITIAATEKVEIIWSPPDIAVARVVFPLSS